ncbi:hypothetical protein NBRC111894_2555 [Sporolactobacillus inulinus]|uniref:Uncharacterized protein n=1 Tax=Sporolactobacillus inulinus TaxID=2078 RepID=A0A4Y1ZDG8_9BACL|nr:hypothetical protein NBRC111894_2555 [Sporolactobacillus inulinus]
MINARLFSKEKRRAFYFCCGMLMHRDCALLLQFTTLKF